jgi:hypothetical protein
MKLIQKGALALLVAACVTIYSCGPTDDKGGMDEKNSSGEGAIDSTRLTNFDSSSTTVGSDSNNIK